MLPHSPSGAIQREQALACARVGRVSRIAYVSGRLGAGKSSLAAPLAAELGYSLVTKDLVKETLHDALYVPGDGEVDEAWSRRLGGASMELLFTLAARAGDMVIEANFHPHSEYELDKLRGLGDRIVEVHCACPAEVAVARYNARPRHEVPLAEDGDADRDGQIRRAGRHRLARGACQRPPASSCQVAARS